MRVNGSEPISFHRATVRITLKMVLVAFGAQGTGWSPEAGDQGRMKGRMQQAALPAGIQQQQDAAEDAQPAIPRHEKVVVGLIVLVAFCLQLRAAFLREFWFDELCTYLVSSAPTLKDMFRAIPLDGNPPLYFLLARLCLHLPVRTELALRLPSILATDATAVLVFLFVRRNARFTPALLSVCAYLGSGFCLYSCVEARPYALLLFFTTACAFSWQSAARGRRRKLALCGIAASMAGAILSHQYGIIYASFPLFTGEMIRLSQRRRLDAPVIVAWIAGAATLLITIPATLHAQSGLLLALKQDEAFWARPQLKFLLLYIHAMPPLIPIAILAFGIPAVVAGAVVAEKYWNSGQQGDERVWVHKEDLCVGLAFILILPLMLLITRLGTNYFAARYAVGTSLGFSIVLGLLLSRPRVRSQKFETVLYALVAYCLLMAYGVLLPDEMDRMARVQTDPLFLSIAPGEEIVMSDALMYFPAWWYSPGVRNRLHYLSDLSYAEKQRDFIPEYSLVSEHSIGTPAVDDYREFLATHREFVLYCYGVPRREWLRDRLKSDGWKLTLLGSEWWKNTDDEPTGAHELYRVTAPVSR